MKRSRYVALFALLLLAPPAGADPIRDRAEARALAAEQRWADAAVAFREIVAANPHRGSDWFNLGASLARQGNCREARPAFERALALGVNGTRRGLVDASVEAAACAAAEGDTEAALSLLRTARLRYGFDGADRIADDPRFASLARDERFLQLFGAARLDASDRVAGWRSDLEAFAALLRARHPNPFHSISEAEWRAHAADLRARIPNLSDAGIVAGFMELASMIGDGHTVVLPPLEGPGAFHLLPIWPYAFGAEWRILAAAPEHADLVGSRIVALNGAPIEDVMARIHRLTPYDNSMTRLWMGAVALQFAESGAYAAGSTTADAVELEVDGPNGRRTVRLAGGPIDRDPGAPTPPAGWPSIPNAADAPLWLARASEAHWIQSLNHGEMIYAQINRIGDGEARTFAQFVEELGRRIRSSRVRTVVLDLRHNNGGDGMLNWLLVREIVRTPAIDREGGVFVIVGRRTFSAAMNLASMLETRTHAIFVGEPTGSRPNFFGEDTPFVLPYSGLTGSISSAWFQGGQSSDDLRPWIAPQLLAPLTFEDLRAGRDPAMAAIEAFLSEQTR